VSARWPRLVDERAGRCHSPGGRHGVSDGYLSQLRNGKKNNPSARNLAAIAALFGVPLAYFFDAQTAKRIDDDLPSLHAIRDRGVQSLVLRAHGLSPASIASLIVFIDQARKFEGLPEIQGNDSLPNRD